VSSKFPKSSTAVVFFNNSYFNVFFLLTLCYKQQEETMPYFQRFDWKFPQLNIQNGDLQVLLSLHSKE
jgi:hypothetical protein